MPGLPSLRRFWLPVGVTETFTGVFPYFRFVMHHFPIPQPDRAPLDAFIDIFIMKDCIELIQRILEICTRFQRAHVFVNRLSEHQLAELGIWIRGNAAFEAQPNHRRDLGSKCEGGGRAKIGREGGCSSLGQGWGRCGGDSWREVHLHHWLAQDENRQSEDGKEKSGKNENPSFPHPSVFLAKIKRAGRLVQGA